MLVVIGRYLPRRVLCERYAVRPQTALSSRVYVIAYLFA